jgi:hypothetical protein
MANKTKAEKEAERRAALTQEERDAEDAAKEDEDDEDEDESDSKDAKPSKAHGGIRVGNPEIMRPKTLPLVVLPPKGDAWANEAQEVFAGILNGYAYRNTEKWEAKKDALLKQLLDLEKNPGKLAIYMGTAADGGKVKYSDKRFQ